MWTDPSFKGLFVAQKLGDTLLHQKLLQRYMYRSHNAVSMLYYAASVRAVFMLLKLNTQRQVPRAAAPSRS
jgi:hypothetical protein